MLAKRFFATRSTRGHFVGCSFYDTISLRVDLGLTFSNPVKVVELSSGSIFIDKNEHLFATVLFLFVIIFLTVSSFRS